MATVSTQPAAPGIDSILSQMMKMQGGDPATTKALGNVDAARTNLSNVIAQPKPVMGPTMALPQRPQTGNADVMQAFAQPASIIAIFGSLLTRRPMTAAIQAAAAAMQGYEQGNQEAVQLAEVAWRDNLQLALQQNQLEIDRYRAAIDAHQNDVNAALAEIQAASGEFHDEVALQQVKSGNLASMAQIVESRMRMGIEAQNHLDMMQARSDALDERKRVDDAMIVDKKVRQDLGKEKLGLYKGKTADTVKAKAADLQDLSTQVSGLIDSITTDPTLGGAYGNTRRLVGETVGQVFSGAQDKPAADFASAVENLQAKLTKPYLGAHYFTGNSADEMEKLVKGLNWRDDTSTTLASLEALKAQLDSQVGAVSAAAADVTTDSSNLLSPGVEVIQNGWRYKSENGAMVPVGPE